MSTRGRYIGPASRPVVPGHMPQINPWAHPNAMYAALANNEQIQANIVTNFVMRADGTFLLRADGSLIARKG